MKNPLTIASLFSISFAFMATAVASKLPDTFKIASSEPSKLVYLAINGENQSLAVRGPDYIQVWNIADQTLVKTIPNQRLLLPQTAIKDLQFSPDGKNLVERFYSAPNIVVTNIETGEIVFQKTMEGERLNQALFRFSPSGRSLLIFDPNTGTVDLIDVKKWNTVSTTFIGMPPYKSVYYTGFLHGAVVANSIRIKNQYSRFCI